MADFGIRSVPSIDTISSVVGAPVDATAWGLRKLGVDVPQVPMLGSENVRDILHKYSDFYGPNGPVQTGFRNLTAPHEPPPQMRAPAPEPAQPVPGFDQSTTGHRNDLIGTVADTLGAPADAAAYIMSKVDGQRLPNVPFGSRWWQNAINNPSLTWDQVRGALQTPSIHSMRGIGGLF